MNKPLNKNAYLGTIIISFLLFLETLIIVFCLFPQCIEILCNSEFWTMIGAITAAGTLIFSCVQFNKELQLRKIERTLTSYLQLRDSAKDADKIISKFTKNDLWQSIAERLDNAERQSVYAYLKALERVACGVNENLYDIDTIFRMSGNLLISQYDNFYKKFIPHIKEVMGNSSIPDNHFEAYAYEFYNEYEKMIDTLRSKVDNKNGQANL